MLDIRDVRRVMRALEIGTGAGYNAAQLAELVGTTSLVTTIEIQEDIAAAARNVLADEGYASLRVVQGDGVYGFPEGGPYDRIEATVGCSDLSPCWLRQLAPDGQILLPLQHGHLHPLILIEPSALEPQHAVGRWVGHSSFMAIQGAMAWANPWQDYILRGIPRDGERRRVSSVSFPNVAKGAHPLSSAQHRAFNFFLTLSSRELWQTNEGYGLADPGGRASALITGEKIKILQRPGAEACGDRLADRLVDLLELWEQYGRPAPEAYRIEFVPKAEIPDLEAVRDPQWVIERIHFWEIIRLCSPAH